MRTAEGYGYTGNPDVLIDGVQLGRGQRKVTNQFATIIDEDWDNAAANRLREQQQSDLKVWVESAIANGVTGFIAGRDYVNTRPWQNKQFFW